METGVPLRLGGVVAGRRPRDFGSAVLLYARLTAWFRRALRVGGWSAGACFSLATSVGFTSLALTEPDAALVVSTPAAVTISPAFAAPLQGSPRGVLTIVSASSRAVVSIPVPEAFDRLPARVPTVEAIESIALAATIVDVDSAPVLVPGDRVEAPLSFYYCVAGDGGMPSGDGGGFCGVMRDGTTVYPGAAACDYAYLGQTFRVVGDPGDVIYRCADTGSAVHGLHRDIWFSSSDEGWEWQWEVGNVATIEILSD